MRLKKTFGFSLLEMLLVVAVGSTLIMAGLSAYKNVQLNLQMTQITQFVTVMQSQIEWLYNSRNPYPDGNMLDELYAARIVPSNMPIVGSGNSMYVRLPIGTFEIEGNRTTYTMTIDSFSGPLCIRIAGLFTPNSNSRLLQLDVNNDTYRAKRSNDFQNLQQKLIATCKTDDTINDNKIVWTFR